MQSQSILSSVKKLEYLKMLRYITLVTMMTFVSVLVISWQELTPCFQKQGIAVFLALLWWSFRSYSETLFIVEIFQLFGVFLYTQKANTGDIQPIISCTPLETIPTLIVSHFYFFFYGFYVTGFFIFILATITYGFFKFYQTIYADPRAEKERGIRDKAFEDLGTIEFSKSMFAAFQNQTGCSICLVDFEDEEKVVALPVCNHFFHTSCLSKWLWKHCECPYCRSNIKVNLELAKKHSENLSSCRTSIEEIQDEVSEGFDQSVVE